MLDENIKQLRKAKGLSQEELAARLNVVRQAFVGDGNDGVVESALDVSLSHRNVLALGALDAGANVLFSHVSNPYFFLPPICLRGPLRVRALVLVR